MQKMLIALMICLVTAPASAATVRCELTVDGATYLDGPCDFDRDTGGSFRIGSIENRAAPYFAVVSIDGADATGYWNGNPPESHAHDSLGQLKRDGACWVNDRAKVCAWE